MEFLLYMLVHSHNEAEIRMIQQVVHVNGVIKEFPSNMFGLYVPEYFLNLALFRLKIPKSTTQGPRLTRFSSSFCPCR